MSLPPGFLDELRSRVSLAQVVGRKVMWDSRKSKQGKGDMWAPCPFHQEKSASFHVDDRKGFYYCFGCHAKGDAIGFVKDTENVGFMEAVEILAREAGMPMPQRDPQAQKRADRRSQLAEVMEQAVRYYRMQLGSGAAEEARAYLQRRGLSQEGQDRFGIGFAPNQRRGLFEALRARGIEEALIVDAGLAARPDDGGPPYDRFRGRIMFPIRDARGRCIAFGGRSMDPNARAKYLNSPETELFDKGRSLYNHGPAREAAGKGQPLIVAEGYMDVIALVEAGFGGAVAPLGTAVTENQLQLMWRIAPEPVIALDGDKAGLRAAMRVIDLALPLLGAGRSLRFALMPPGKDPDDLIKAEGPGAMQAILDKARPLVDLLWQRETEGQSFDSPERKAALDQRLRELIGRIADPGLRQHYGQAIRDLRWGLFRPGRKEQRPGGGAGARGGFTPGGGTARRLLPVQPRPETCATPLARDPDNRAGERIREMSILAACLLEPRVVATFEADLDRLQMLETEHGALLRAILTQAPEAPSSGYLDAIRDAAGPGTVDSVLISPHVRVTPVFKHRGNLEVAVSTLAESLAKLQSERGLRLEIEEAAEEIGQGRAEYVTYRLAQAAEARNRAERAHMEKDSAFDVAENGARLDRDERDAFRRLLDQLPLGESGKDR
ncbi:DNA primase [Mangrovicoccus algicola]|uniref:DNA primase n=1 Tax=Mangrovicoccus algicola TaxID=2771008 RepID=A0A8J6YXN9_9RHOB|nr:DNA primase [Mangrovicoccus algicola]MBE3637821.1 DNA primase [Mangrovicoccus algicola]